MVSLLQNFFFTLHSVLSMLDHLKISYCRKLCSSICRWLCIHWSCKFKQPYLFSWMCFIFFNQFLIEFCFFLICSICVVPNGLGWRKCGIKARCSVCFHRRIKDNFSFISMDQPFFPHVKLKDHTLVWLDHEFHIFLIGNWFSRCNCSNLHWTVWARCL